MATDTTYADVFNGPNNARAKRIRMRQLRNKLADLVNDLRDVDEDLEEVPDLTLIFENKLL